MKIRIILMIMLIIYLMISIRLRNIYVIAAANPPRIILIIMLIIYLISIQIKKYIRISIINDRHSRRDND